MLIEKEVISPGEHWYTDQATGQPRKLVVTPDLTRYWGEQGNKMLSLGLTVPVPFEHDFDAHPMTPAEKLKANAGWVREYRARDDKLFAVVDIQDDEVAKKLPKTIRWTSPWFSSFTDGHGRSWSNVIAHLALTSRPRITNQAPFPSVAAAMAFALSAPEDRIDAKKPEAFASKTGFVLSSAGQLRRAGDGSAQRLLPEYPVAFSLYSGVAFGDGDDDFIEKKLNGDGDAPPPKSDDAPPPKDGNGDAPPEKEPNGDSIQMTELLSQLLPILGVQMPDARFITSETFIRELCLAMLAKVTAMAAQSQQPAPGENNGNGQKNDAGSDVNPIVQEQQPMYMSLDDIQKIPDPTMKNIALSMYNENAKLRAERDADAKTVASLRDAKLREENAKRASRVAILGRLSPRVKADLDAMLALPGMALSMGDGGVVVDPMAQTLAVLEKGLADMPRLLQTDHSALSVQPQPTDGELSAEVIDKTADDLARMMGCPPKKQAG